VAYETRYVFTFFFKIQKNIDFLRFFEWLTMFSRTLLTIYTNTCIHSLLSCRQLGDGHFLWQILD